MSALFRQEALDNRRERLWGEVLLVQPFSFWLLTGLTVLAAGLIALLLVFGTYARRENVAGFLLPVEGLVKVYAVRQGLVGKAHVREGDLVEAGDPLFDISTEPGSGVDSRSPADAPSTDTEALILAELLDGKRTLQARREGQVELQALRLAGQQDRLPRLAREIARLERLRALNEERVQASDDRLERLRELAAGRFISETDLVDGREAHIELELRLAQARSDLAARRDDLQDALLLSRELPLQSSIELAEIDESLSLLDQQILAARGRRAYTLRAPSAGRVTAVQASAGQLVDERRPLLTLLPEDARYRAELFVPTRSIGFIESGQSVLLRYQAFPYQQFGVQSATVGEVAVTISLPAELDVPVRLEEPVYRVSVTLDEQFITAHGRRFELQAGMLLDASIILESRSLARWLLAPIYSLRGSL